MTIAQGSDQWSDQKLGQGITARQEPKRSTIWCELRQKEWQQWEDNAFAQPIVQQR